MSERPVTMPFGSPVAAEDVHDVWDAFVAPSQSDDAPPQSIETRTLMAILQWTHDKLSPGPCGRCGGA